MRSWSRVRLQIHFIDIQITQILLYNLIFHTLSYVIVKMYTHAQTHARGRAPCRRYWLRPLHSAALNTIPPLLFFSSPELLSPNLPQHSREPCFSSGFQVTGEPPSNFRVLWFREEVGGSERSSRYSPSPAAANATLLSVPVTE